MEYTVENWKELVHLKSVDKDDLVTYMEDEDADSVAIAVVNDNLDGDHFDNITIMDMISSFIEEENGMVRSMDITKVGKVWRVIERRRDKQ